MLPEWSFLREKKVVHKPSDESMAVAREEFERQQRRKNGPGTPRKRPSLTHRRVPNGSNQPKRRKTSSELSTQQLIEIGKRDLDREEQFYLEETRDREYTGHAGYTKYQKSDTHFARMQLAVFAQLGKGEFSETGGMSQRGVCRQFRDENGKEMVLRTLQKYLKKADKVTGLIPRNRVGTLLDPAVEEKVKQYILDCAELGFALEPKDILLAVGQISEKLGKRVVPSSGWWTRFKGRYPEISRRRMQHIHASRAEELNPTLVGKWFELLGKTYAAHEAAGEPIQVSDVWNMDETGFTLVMSRSYGLVRRGAKQAHRRTHSSQELITAITCACADGTLVPCFFVQKGAQRNSDKVAKMKADTSPLCEFTLSKNGWTTEELFGEWCIHFVKHVNRKFNVSHSKSRRWQLLVLDGHDSHLMNPDALAYLDENRVKILSLPSHTSSALQSCDVSLFKPVETSYRNQLDSFLRLNPNTPLSKWDVPKFAHRAHQDGGTEENIKAGFCATGIWPYNPNWVEENMDKLTLSTWDYDKQPEMEMKSIEVRYFTKPYVAELESDGEGSYQESEAGGGEASASDVFGETECNPTDELDEQIIFSLVACRSSRYLVHMRIDYRAAEFAPMLEQSVCGYLNDTCMSTLYGMIAQRHGSRMWRSTFSTIFVNYFSVRETTEAQWYTRQLQRAVEMWKDCTENRKVLLIPLHKPPNHWVHVSVYFSERKIVYCDSLERGAPALGIKTGEGYDELYNGRDFLNILVTFLQEIELHILSESHCSQEMKPLAFEVCTPLQDILQSDNYQCGMFSVVMAETVAATYSRLGFEEVINQLCDKSTYASIDDTGNLRRTLLLDLVRTHPYKTQGNQCLETATEAPVKVTEPVAQERETLAHKAATAACKAATEEYKAATAACKAAIEECKAATKECKAAIEEYKASLRKTSSAKPSTNITNNYYYNPQYTVVCDVDSFKRLSSKPEAVVSEVLKLLRVDQGEVLRSYSQERIASQFDKAGHLHALPKVANSKERIQAVRDAQIARQRAFVTKQAKSHAKQQVEAIPRLVLRNNGMGIRPSENLSKERLATFLTSKKEVPYFPIATTKFEVLCKAVELWGLLHDKILSEGATQERRDELKQELEQLGNKSTKLTQGSDAEKLELVAKRFQKKMELEAEARLIMAKLSPNLRLPPEGRVLKRVLIEEFLSSHKVPKHTRSKTEALEAVLKLGKQL